MGLLDRWDRRNQRTMERHAAEDPASQPPHPLLDGYYSAQMVKVVVMGFVLVIAVVVTLARAILG